MAANRPHDHAQWTAATDAQRRALVRALVWGGRPCRGCTRKLGGQCRCETRRWQIYALEKLHHNERCAEPSVTIAQNRLKTTAAAKADIIERMHDNPTLVFAVRNADATWPIGNWGSVDFAGEFLNDQGRDRLGQFEWTFVWSNVEAAAFVHEYDDDDDSDDE